jgi:G3E family GTPase
MLVRFFTRVVLHPLNSSDRGSAFPATLAFQIRELERQTQGDFNLDAIVTVVDAENFAGYEDTSPTVGSVHCPIPTSLMRAGQDAGQLHRCYLDCTLPTAFIRLKIQTFQNKWELVDERVLDIVLDHLHTLNDMTPKIRCQGRNGVDPNLIFGRIASKLFLEPDQKFPSHNDEVETISLCTGSVGMEHNHPHHSEPHIPEAAVEAPDSIDERVLTEALDALSKESVWRVKGFVRLTGKGMHILNWAFGRFDLTAVGDDVETESVKLTVMGERGELRRAIGRFQASLKART